MKKNKKLLAGLLKNKRRRVKEVYLLGTAGLVSCGGGGDAGGDGGGSRDIDFSSGDDKRDFSGKGGESYFVSGLNGRDRIKTGGESDVVRGGLEKDEVYVGGGDDVVLLVGETMEGEYAEEDVEAVLKEILSVGSGGGMSGGGGVDGRSGVDGLNGRGQTEAVKGEVVDGGAGKDTLVIYGRVDLREVIVRNVERVRLHSELILDERQLREFESVKGDGESVVRLESSRGEGSGRGGNGGGDVVEFDMEELEELSGVERLEIGVGVKVVVSSRKGVELLGNVGIVGGLGQLEYKDLLGEDGEVELTALELARSGKGSFTEEFVNNEQIVVDASQTDYADLFYEKVVDYVFVLKEGDSVVDIGDFTLSAGMSVVVAESDGGFSVVDGGSGVGLELRSIVKNYENAVEKSFVIVLNDGTRDYRVKILLVDVNEDSRFIGGTTGTIKETSEESVTGTLSVEDEDGDGEEFLFSGDIEGKYGVLNVKKDGSWEYKLDGKDFRVRNLLEGENLTDSIEVMSVGGTRGEVVITIEGYGTAEDDLLPRISVELNGEGFVGEELRMEILGEDEDLLEVGTYSFAWFRKEEGEDGVVENVAIARETGQSYLLKAGDLGKTIVGKLILGRFETETEEGVTVWEKELAFDIAIEGMEKEGETLMATIGDISLVDDVNVSLSLEDFEYEYYWFRAGERVELGGGGGGYVLTDEDGGNVVKVGVFLKYIGENEAYEGYQGYVEKESGVIAYVDSGLEGELSLRGRGIEGELLFVNLEGLMDEDGLTEASYVYQWYRGEIAIEGAVYRSYLLGQDDVGESISVKVTVTDDEGHVGSVSVAVEQLIENVDNPALGRVRILGTVHEQETITANLEGLSDVDGLADDDSFVYVWFRDGVEIEGEMGQELSIEDEWVGSTISVEVSFADLLGNEYKSRSFEREVYEARIPRIREAILEVDENEMGIIGTLETGFFGRGELTYTVDSAFASVVSVNSAGVVNLLEAQNYESRTGFDVLVTVRSELGFGSSEEISIIVRDVDDVPPSGIELLDGAGDVLSVRQATEGNVGLVGTLTAMDVDTEVEDLVFSTSDTRFSIDVETVAGVDYYVLKSDASLDFEGLLVMGGITQVGIRVSDGENADTIENLSVSVIDVDDVAPRMIRVNDGTNVVANVVAAEGMDSLFGNFGCYGS